MDQSHQFDPSRRVPAVEVPDRLGVVVRKLGAAGERWLAQLPVLLAGLEAEWGITVGKALTGGQSAYVAEAVTDDGRPVVVKVAVPAGIDVFTPDRERVALLMMGGDPYAEVIRFHRRRGAMLLERLGPPMASLGWPMERQLDALARLAARGWHPVRTNDSRAADDGRAASNDSRAADGGRVVENDGWLPDGAESARWHAEFIPRTWEELGRPCPVDVVEVAAGFAAGREAAYDPSRAVLVHGDVHAYNALLVPGTEDAFRLVDPSGLMSEPAHDLGVIQIRGVQGVLESGMTLTERCARAGRLTGVDPDAIRQWAYVELVSTGLFLLSLGHDAEAATYLATASAGPR